MSGGHESKSAVHVRDALPPSLRIPSNCPRRPWLDVLGAVLVVSFFVGGAWAAYWADHRNDQYQLLGLGQCVYGGERLYVDCWENKPPGLAWVNALGLVATGGDAIGAWVLPAVLGILCTVVLWIAVSKQLGPTPGRRAAVFAAALFSTRAYDAATINPDFYSAILELVAAACWLAAITRESRWRGAGLALLAGLVWSAATSVKQTGCIAPAVLGVVTLALLVLRHADSRRWAAITSATWFGFALGCGAVVFVLSQQGILHEARAAIFDFNRSLLDPSLLWRAIKGLPNRESYFIPLYLPLCLSLFGVVATCLVGRAGPVSKAVVLSLTLWAMGAAWSALAGPSGAMRYWQATFPPLLLLSAVALFHLGEMFRRLERGYQIAFVILSLAAMIPLGRPLFRTYRLGLAESYLAYAEPPNDRTRYETMGTQLRELVPTGERIYVWGYDAGVYIHAQRRPASRFTYPRSHEQAMQILTDLETHKPFALLIRPGSPSEFAEWYHEEYAQRRDALLTGYTKTRTVEGYEVWVRANDSVQSSAKP